jgi:hypothetical protein
VTPAPPSPLGLALFGSTLGAVAGVPAAVLGVVVRNVAIPSANEAFVAVLSGLLVGTVGGFLTGLFVGLAARVTRTSSAVQSWVGIASVAGAASVGLSHPGQTLFGTVLIFTTGAVGALLVELLFRGLYRALRASRVVCAVALGWLLLCLLGEAYAILCPSPAVVPLPVRPEEPVVQLWSAPVPGVGLLARHCWFASWEPGDGQWRRWEVWQHPNVGGTSWGHVHRDLMGAGDDVGAGGARVVREWRGREAAALIAVLNDSPRYPWSDRYASLPGPNSNTYVRWVLRRANVEADLSPRALGKDYLGPFGCDITTTGTGVQLETSLAGVKAGLIDGVEIHLICLTFGVGYWPPAVKTPLGRFGFPE